MGKKKGNNYIIDNENNIAKIELHRTKDENLWTIIDLEDLERVLQFPYTWHSAYKEKTKSYYCKATVHTGIKVGDVWKSYPLYLQQFLIDSNLDIHKRIDIDHRNHDTLDNRKENLRVSYREYNSKNRNGRNSNNTTGYRNVIYNKTYPLHPYVVQLQINGKNKVLGKFSDVDEAGSFAEEMRQKYYGEFAGETERVC